MDLAVAICAQSDEVLLAIVPVVTSETSVMDFEVVSAAAELALPTIALKHALTQLLICLGVEPHTGLFRTGKVHDAFSFSKYFRNVCRC